MPKFITIGYGDQAGYSRTLVSVRHAAHAYDADLRKHGMQMGIAGAPVQVRNPDDNGVGIKSGPFMASDLPLAGFTIIEDADLSKAIAMVSHIPRAMAHGVVEVWPLK